MSINKLVNTDIALGPWFINNMRMEHFEIVRRLLISGKEIKNEFERSNIEDTEEEISEAVKILAKQACYNGYVDELNKEG